MSEEYYCEYFFSVCCICSVRVLEQLTRGVIIQHTGCNHFSNKHHNSSSCISAKSRVTDKDGAYTWRFTNTSRRKVIREIREMDLNP
jgi:hypothetical protein